MQLLGKTKLGSSVYFLLKSLSAALLFALMTSPALADILASTGAKSLGTTIDRRLSMLEVKGGVVRGRNRFHRFNKFDTRDSQITAIKFVNPGTPNILMGVLSHTYIDKPLALMETGNLYILSPRGITVSRGSSYSNISTLMLSTAVKFRLGNSLFDYDSLTDLRGGDFALEPATIPLTESGILAENLANGSTSLGIFESQETNVVNAVIEIEEGVNLSVDQSLLIAANRSPIKISNAQIKAEGSAPDQGLIILGADISIDKSSELDSNSQVVILPKFSTPSFEDVVVRREGPEPEPVEAPPEDPLPQAEPTVEIFNTWDEPPSTVPAPHISPNSKVDPSANTQFSFETISLSLQQITVSEDDSSSLSASSDLDIQELNIDINLDCFIDDIESNQSKATKCNKISD